MAERVLLFGGCDLLIPIVTFASCGWICLTGSYLSTVFVVCRPRLRPMTVYYGQESELLACQLFQCKTLLVQHRSEIKKMSVDG